jgi:hypothetical protein
MFLEKSKVLIEKLYSKQKNKVQFVDYASVFVGGWIFRATLGIKNFLHNISFENFNIIPS